MILFLPCPAAEKSGSYNFPWGSSQDYQKLIIQKPFATERSDFAMQCVLFSLVGGTALIFRKGKHYNVEYWS